MRTVRLNRNHLLCLHMSLIHIAWVECRLWWRPFEELWRHDFHCFSEVTIRTRCSWLYSLRFQMVLSLRLELFKCAEIVPISPTFKHRFVTMHSFLLFLLPDFLFNIIFLLVLLGMIKHPTRSVNHFIFFVEFLLPHFSLRRSLSYNPSILINSQPTPKLRHH